MLKRVLKYEYKVELFRAHSATRDSYRKYYMCCFTGKLPGWVFNTPCFVANPLHINKLHAKQTHMSIRLRLHHFRSKIIMSCFSIPYFPFRQFYLFWIQHFLGLFQSCFDITGTLPPSKSLASVWRPCCRWRLVKSSCGCIDGKDLSWVMQSSCGLLERNELILKRLCNLVELSLVFILCWLWWCRWMHWLFYLCGSCGSWRSRIVRKRSKALTSPLLCGIEGRVYIACSAC